VLYTEVPGVKTRRWTNGTTDRVVRVLAGIGTGVRYGVHNNSLNNLLRGVAERVLYKNHSGELRPPPPPKAGAFTRLRYVKRTLLRHLSPTPIVALEEYPMLYGGRKRIVYEKAVTELLSRGFRSSDANIRAFVKAEKINFTAKGDPAPRVIQPRSPMYNAMVGCYLKQFEKRLFRGFKAAFGYDVVLKGLNADGVGNKLHESWAMFNEPVGVGLDASRFDQHVSVQALEFEHSIYNSVFRDERLRKLLRLQLHNKVTGLANDGMLKYEVEGRRMSGDINTGMGNCLLMSLIVLGYLDENKVQARLANNGDDCVLFLERRDLGKLTGLSKWFKDFGFVLTQEKPCYVFEEVEFCQSHPVRVGDGWRMVRDIRTAPSKDAVSLLGWDNQTNFNAWRNAIGSCGLSLTSGVPVWEAYYNSMSDGTAPEWAMDQVTDSGMGYMARGVKQAVITDDTRYSFYLAFGMLPDMQEALESSMPRFAYSEPRPMIFADIERMKSPLQLWLESDPTKTALHHGPTTPDL